MKSKLFKTVSNLAVLFLMSGYVLSVSAQELIYKISGSKLNDNSDTVNIPLNSILVVNTANNTELLFDWLQEQDEYIIDLTNYESDDYTGMREEIMKSEFSLMSNIPGDIKILIEKDIYTGLSISVYNVHGQKVYTSSYTSLQAGTLLSVTLPYSEVYIVQIRSMEVAKAFKALGSPSFSYFKVSESDMQGSRKGDVLKSGIKSADEEFSFKRGDTLRIFAYKDGYFSRSKIIVAASSCHLDFFFKPDRIEIDGISNVYVDLTDTNNVSINYDPSTGIAQIYYASDTVIDIEPGDIFTIDCDTTGYLRKVVSKNAQNGKLTVETTQAYLNEVFVNKSFSLNTEYIPPKSKLKSSMLAQQIINALTDEEGYIHPVEIIYYGENGKVLKSVFEDNNSGERINLINIGRDFSGTNIYHNNYVDFSFDEGHLTFTADAVFSFGFNNYNGQLEPDTRVEVGELNYFEFYIQGTSEFLTKLLLSMSASYQKEDTKKLVDIRKVTARFIVPPNVPVWITFDVDIYGHYTFSADASLQADWGFRSTHTVKVGGTYYDYTGPGETRAYSGSFTPIAEYTPDNEIYPLNIDGEVNLNTRLELYPRAEVKFYDIFGPYAEVVPYIKGNYNAAMHTQVTSDGSEDFLAWESGIDLGLDLRMGTLLTFVNINRSYGPQTVNCFNKKLYSSPADISLVDQLPAYVDPDSLIDVKLLVTDTLDNPVPLSPVYISGDGSFSDEMLITNSDGEVSFTWELLNSGESEFKAKLFNADQSERREFTFSVNVDGVTDYDGNRYDVVKIGNLWWMAENIKAITYKTASGYYSCFPMDDDNNTDLPHFYRYSDTIPLKDKIGFLYDYNAAVLICPEGWHLPTKDDWQELMNYVVNDGHTDVAESLKAMSGWNNNGTDDYGFSAYPAGEKSYYGLSYGVMTRFWSATMGYYDPEDDNWCAPNVYTLYINNNDELYIDRVSILENGFSVRCVKN